QNDVTLKMPAFEWVHVQLHQQKGMISLSPPTICNSASFPRSRRFCNKKQGHGGRRNQTGMWYYRGGCLSLSGSGKTQVPEMRRPHSLIH
ncbi:hypothetical protein ACWJQD_29370, partial [Klebsiella pneumoniae]